MWFRMPQGVAGISVERQNFQPDIEFEGRAYFRAPDHFAPRILANKGFELVEKPPEGFPEDIPRADPLRDGAIAELTATVEALKRENGDLRTDLNATVAKAGALVKERDELQAKLDEANRKVEELEEKIEDLTEAAPTLVADSKKK
jgi:hypothetical protein